MRRAVQQRLAHLERRLNQNALSAQVVVTREKVRCRVEITLHARGEHFLHGEATAREWLAALAAAAAKIERQAQTLVGRWKEHKRRPSVGPQGIDEQPPAPERDDAQAVRIIRARRYAVKPMLIDDAALEMGDGRAAFLVFRNASNDAITVLYRRPDGHLGLIEPEA